MIPAELLRQHLEYSAWASRKLVQAVKDLSLGDRMRDFGTADKNALGTLVHIFAADRMWLGRVEGNVPARFLDVDRDMHMSALERDWPAVQDRWIALDVAPDTVISYHDLKGNPYQTPFSEIVLHLVNHATHHRGQVAGFLRAMGHTPPSLDLIRFYRDLQAAAAGQ